MRLLGWCIRCKKFKNTDVRTNLCQDCEEEDFPWRTR